MECRQYGRDHASRFVEFLLNATNKLKTDYLRGRRVPTRPAHQYITITRGNRGQGYVAIYEIEGDTLNVLDYFHTAENWQAKLGVEP